MKNTCSILIIALCFFLIGSCKKSTQSDNQSIPLIPSKPKTLAVLSNVTVLNIKNDSVLLTANILDSGNDTAKLVGFQFGVDSLKFSQVLFTYKSNSFQSQLKGLEPGQKYYVRAVAENSVGASFSQISAFYTDSNYKIGGIGKKGGIIFYDKGNYNNGWRYIECKLTNSGTTRFWSRSDIEVAGLLSGIGNGRENTDKLINIGGGGSGAVNLCKTSGWYLPTRAELGVIYSQLFKKGLGNFNTTDTYWTSEQTGTVFYAVRFLNNNTQIDYYPSSNNWINVRLLNRF
jgi:hypothetical protein